MKDSPALGSNFDGKTPLEFCRSAICGDFMVLLMCIKEHTQLRMKPLESEKNLRMQAGLCHTSFLSPHPATACRAE